MITRTAITFKGTMLISDIKNFYLFLLYVQFFLHLFHFIKINKIQKEKLYPPDVSILIFCAGDSKKKY